MRLGEREQGVELAALVALELVAGRALVDHAPLVDDVGQAVGHPGVGGQAVAAGAAGLLVVALDVLRQVEVGDEAHVGLVDAHAEGDGRDHDDAVFAQEAILVALAHVGVEAGVVRQGGDALLDQPGRGLVDLLARLAVDDAGLAGVLVAQEGEQLVARLVLLDHRVADVRPVEAADEDARVVPARGARRCRPGSGRRRWR